MHASSLRRRTVATGVTVVAVVLSSLGLVLYLSVAHELRQSTRAVLQERLDLAAGLAQQHDATELAGALQSAGIVAVVTRPDGSITYGTPSSPAPAGGLPAPPGSPSSQLVGSLRHPDGSIVEISVSRAGAIRVLDHVRNVLIGGAVAGVGLAALLLWRGAEIALRPLEVVVDAARRIARGERGIRIGPDRTDTEVGLVGAAFDHVVDGLETAVEDARRQAEASERFLADAAHQLRTPITAIQAAAEALSFGLDEAGRERATTLIVGQTNRAGTLLAGLLRLAKLDMGQVPSEEVVDLETLCGTEVARARELSPGLEIVVRGGVSGAVPIELDPAAMGEALANLLDNARRHARHRILLELAIEEPDIVIRICDDGPGVPPDAAEIVFDRFVSLDDRGGSGLGLAIARAIVEAHGGALRYEEEGFVIRIARERRLRPRPGGVAGPPLASRR